MDVYKMDAENSASECYYKYVKKMTVKKTKLEPPLNLVETIASFDSSESFKKQFIGLSVILSTSYRQKLRMLSKTNMNEAKENPSCIKAPVKVKRNLTRAEFVPETFMQCKSSGSKCAIATFCMSSFKEAIRRDVLFAVLQNVFQSVDEIIEFAKENVRSIKQAVQGNTSCSEDTRKILIGALLRTSDILHDRSYSRLAMSVQPKIYMLAVKHFVKKNSFVTHCPYDALVSNYVQTCIAPKLQASERQKIANQFNVNASAIVDSMISNLSIDEVAERFDKFNEDRIYYVFEGPPNFPRDLAFTYREHNGKTYQVMTYKDCLYDVVGTEDSLFSAKTWQERLDSIEYTAKIILRKKTGSELNEYRGNATLAASWMDKNKFHCKYFTFSKRDMKK